MLTLPVQFLSPNPGRCVGLVTFRASMTGRNKVQTRLMRSPQVGDFFALAPSPRRSAYSTAPWLQAFFASVCVTGPGGGGPGRAAASWSGAQTPGEEGARDSHIPHAMLSGRGHALLLILTTTAWITWFAQAMWFHFRLLGVCEYKSDHHRISPQKRGSGKMILNSP